MPNVVYLTCNNWRNSLYNWTTSGSSILPLYTKPIIIGSNSSPLHYFILP